jgi:hypothetical protein
VANGYGISRICRLEVQARADLDYVPGRFEKRLLPKMLNLKRLGEQPAQYSQFGGGERSRGFNIETVFKTWLHQSVEMSHLLHYAISCAVIVLIRMPHNIF